MMSEGLRKFLLLVENVLKVRKYIRYGQNCKIGCKYKLLMYIKGELNTSDMAEIAKSDVNISCLCI